MTVRLRLDVGYDGGAFAGWATQPGQRTVQGTLEEALGTVLRAPATLTVAGRTDAGVHATGQVCHVDVAADAWAELSRTLLRRLNGLLPLDVRVTGVAGAPPGFDARFSALWRRYAYRLTDAPHGADPLRRHDTVPWRRPLDEAAMNAAAAPLLGEHDFAAYCRRREGASTVRALQRLYWTRTGHLLVATVRADAFCHNMVRALVGAMIAVGEGRRPPDWPAAVLATGVRDPGVLVVPAHGLTLVEVGYPDPAGLADRAALTRRYRGEAVV